MKRSLQIIVLFLLIFSSCSDPNNKEYYEFPSGVFMGIQESDQPEILYPGFISTRMGEYNGTFNPEGTAFFFTTSVLEFDVIVSAQMQEDSTWSKPEIVSFAADYPEFDPLFSPDGKRLYFSSHRPVLAGGDTDASNIWYVEKISSGWGIPEYVNLPGPKRGNYYSSITNDGIIYFNIWNTGDLYRSTNSDSGYQVERLPDGINSEQGDGDPFVAADESYLIFRSYRKGGVGSGDLWISFRLDNKWHEPVNLGEPINSKYNEMCPYVTVDGKLFIFSSGRLEKTYYESGIKNLDDVEEKLDTHDNGQQNIFTMSASFIPKMRDQFLKDNK